MTKEEFLDTTEESLIMIKNSTDNFDLLRAITLSYSAFTDIFMTNQFHLSQKDIDLKFSSNEFAAQYRRQAIDKTTPINDAREYATASIDVLRYIVNSIF